MNILSISGFFETLDPTQLLPPAGTFLALSVILIIICLFVGPVLMFLAGQKYIKAPSPLPHFKTGFRTYFGMGSKAAWDYAQRLAGVIWSALGGAATLIAALFFIGKNPAQIAFISLVVMIVQASLTVLSWAAVTIMVTVNYDKQGQLRK